MITVRGACVQDNVDSVAAALGYPIPGQYGMTHLDSITGGSGVYEVTERVLLHDGAQFVTETVSNVLSFSPCADAVISPEFLALQVGLFGVGWLVGLQR